jgi:hypothetical protein
MFLKTTAGASERAGFIDTPEIALTHLTRPISDEFFLFVPRIF